MVTERDDSAPEAPPEAEPVTDDGIQEVAPPAPDAPPAEEAPEDGDEGAEPEAVAEPEQPKSADYWVREMLADRATIANVPRRLQVEAQKLYGQRLRQQAQEETAQAFRSQFEQQRQIEERFAKFDAAERLADEGDTEALRTLREQDKEGYAGWLIIRGQRLLQEQGYGQQQQNATTVRAYQSQWSKLEDFPEAQQSLAQRVTAGEFGRTVDAEFVANITAEIADTIAQERQKAARANGNGRREQAAPVRTPRADVGGSLSPEGAPSWGDMSPEARNEMRMKDPAQAERLSSEYLSQAVKARG